MRAAEIRRLHRETGATVVYVTHDQGEALSLGERVAVLDAGRLRQVGEPDEVYEQPADRFVASFVGSPPMNLVAATVAGGVLRGPGPVVLALTAPLAEGSRVLAGFRPEGAACPLEEGGSRHAFAARVDAVERAGHERLWHLVAGEQRFAARPAPGAQATPGDTVAVAVDPAAVRLFDLATGRALR